MSIQNAYNQWSEIYDSNENLTRDLDQMLTRSTFSGQHFHSILELGCGTGKNTAFFVEIGDKVHALDFSEGMIAKAKEKIQAGNLTFSTADLTQKWPCENGAYDLISCKSGARTYQGTSSYLQ
jgi:ubiquinone/menaquinone biosynthesis C-methylase UbiE